MNPKTSPFTADRALLDALNRRSKPFSCADGDQVLFREGEEAIGLFVLYSGNAQLEMRSHSGEVVARFAAGDGSLLGLPATITGTKYSVTAIAEQGSEVRFVDRTAFLDLISSVPALWLLALQAMAAQIQAASRVLTEELTNQWSLNEASSGNSGSGD